MGGSKEDEPGEWDFTVETGGVNPGKANILDAWSAVDQDGADTFVYLGFARASATSTFRRAAARRSSRSSSTTTRASGTTDRRRFRVGDGRHPDFLRASRQRCRRGAPAVDHHGRPTLAPGCATSGRLDGLTGLTPNVDVQGAINARRSRAGFRATTRERCRIERFGEAALNLSQILEDALGIDECFSFASVWMHSRSSTSEQANMQDYVAPHKIIARSCSASGDKFHDLDADGVRDPGEPGLPGWIIWADYDNDGVKDAAEPFGITDAEGHYVINDIRPPGGTYMLRETLATKVGLRRARVASVACSYPNDSTPGGTGSAPRRHLPLWLGADPVRNHDLRAFPRLRQLRAGHPGGREAARAEQRPGPFRPARERPSSPSRLRGTARAGLRKSGPAPTQFRRLPRLGRTRPTIDQPSSAKLKRGERGSARAASTRTSDSGPDSWQCAPSATSASARP